VLVEGVAKGRWYGRTRTNKLVHFASDLALAGALVNVRITATEPWFLEGELEPSPSGAARDLAEAASR
jgi:tRNA-2-methylthio-N6-dimethylallyladenosine synthase